MKFQPGLKRELGHEQWFCVPGNKMPATTKEKCFQWNKGDKKENLNYFPPIEKLRYNIRKLTPMQTWLNSMIKAVRELSHGLGQLEDIFSFNANTSFWLRDMYSSQSQVSLQFHNLVGPVWSLPTCNQA